MTPKKEKILLLILSCVGILCVAYGMTTKNHPVFIVGLILIIAAYLIIRKKLKASSQNLRQDEEINNKNNG